MLFFLRAKHWQIFMITFGVAMMALAVQLLFVFRDNQLVYPGEIYVNRGATLVIVASAIAKCWWMYAVGMKLLEKRPYNALNENLFIAALAFQVIYSVTENIVFPYWGYESAVVNFIFALGSTAVAIYSSYFLAKALRSVELDRDDNLDGYGGDLFLFLFDPIGVWWLQPRINRIFGNVAGEYDPDAPLDQNINIQS